MGDVPPGVRRGLVHRVDVMMPPALVVGGIGRLAGSYGKLRPEQVAERQAHLCVPILNRVRCSLLAVLGSEHIRT